MNSVRRTLETKLNLSLNPFKWTCCSLWSEWHRNPWNKSFFKPVLKQSSGNPLYTETVACCNHSCPHLKDLFPMHSWFKWWGTKSTALVLGRNVSQSLCEINMRLQQSELIRSSGYLPKLPSFYCKSPSSCFPDSLRSWAAVEVTERGNFALKRPEDKHLVCLNQEEWMYTRPPDYCFKIDLKNCQRIL